MDQYCILGRIGEGAHGIVFKAKHVETGEIVALKKVALRRLGDGISSQALREIKALQEMEDSPYDLKPANLLISASGQLKIADFGLARVLSPDGSCLYTHQVATRWYRAPELLYGACQYDQGVDLWAVGCILGELLNGSPLFPGENDIDQLCCVIRILGTPSRQVWPEITELPDYNKISFKDQAPMPLGELLPDAPPQALDLLGHFLRYPPRQRIAASQALLHPYFFTAPLPDHPSELLIPQRPRGSTPEAHPGPSHGRDFNVDRPLEESLLDPELIRPFIPEG
ncbi:cyclin-dependent kinase 20 isoform X3 [Manis pentadactyla]|uniref:cyclin-dependent kinase 20 isoform X3 n=1 Tax=Manis pentadactyla TaxID=143292 RepID=UPI00255CDC34|nr:cyclin-dependent kinase 20 isoform X3 [Manis pentadactyla]